MKKALFILSFCFHNIFSISQSVDYTVIKDDPNATNWLSVNLDWFQLELHMPHTSAIEAASANIGVWGHFEPGIPLGIQYSFQKSWFVFGGLGNTEFPKNSEYQLGGYFFLRNKSKTKNVKVILKSVEKLDIQNDAKVISSTYITIPGLVRNQFGLRGGVMSKSTPHVFEDEPGQPDPFIEAAKHNSFTMYAGLLGRKTTNLIIDTEEFGKCANSGARSWYLDALISPVNHFKDFMNDDLDVTDQAKETISSSFPIGIRFGYMMYQMEKKAFTGKKFGVASKYEVGYKPYLGPYISASLAITLVKASR